MGDQYGHHRRMVEAELLRFGSKNLKHSDEFEEQGNALAHKLFLKLQNEMSKLSSLKKTKFTVKERYIAGSFGKKTDVIEPDLDLVVLVNNCMPDDYPKVLELFEQILILNEDYLKIEEKSIVRKSRFIKFKFKNGIEVDLLPATAMLTLDEVYAILRENPENFKDYSTCFVQRQKGFMKAQDSFTHALIRLLKFWFKTLHLRKKKVSGASFMMELIGTAASLEQAPPNDSKSMLQALNTALTLTSRLDSLKLILKEESEGKWKRIPEREITPEFAKNQVGCLRDIITRKEYFIVDPVNPWQELLQDIEFEIIMKLKQFAAETQRRIGMLMEMRSPYVSFDGKQVVVDIYKIFEPQPLSLKQTFPSGDPNNLLVSYMERATSPCCDMEVRREEPMKRKEVQLYVEALKRVLLLRVNSMQTTTCNFSIEDVKDAVETMLEDCLEAELVPASGKHENMAVTLTVPYHVGHELYCMKLSLDWR